ncbi:hypothetical protein RE943_17070 [Prescottella equi]|nr:hypothetical protein RE943_17070 [Prescottella equi]
MVLERDLVALPVHGADLPRRQFVPRLVADVHDAEDPSRPTDPGRANAWALSMNVAPAPSVDA